MKKLRSRLSLLVLLTLVGGVSVAALYAMSEDIMQHRNPFIRRFPPQAVRYKDATNLQYNSYYFAGQSSDTVFLGNYTAPFLVLCFDRKTARLTEYPIEMQAYPRKYQRLRLAVSGKDFYLFDGSLPVVYKGARNNWTVNETFAEPPFFINALPTSEGSFVFRGNARGSGRNLLGIFTIHDKYQARIFPELIQKQNGGDGIFDTDGILLYNQRLSKIIYLHHYRNEIIVADELGRLNYRGHTIDTIIHANIKTAELKSKKQRAMAAPPLNVNKHAAVFGKLLFVESALKGKYDDESAWKRSSTIDVYDLVDNKYLQSFYLSGNGTEKLRSFIATDTEIFMLIDSRLVRYEYSSQLKSKI